MPASHSSKLDKIFSWAIITKEEPFDISCNMHRNVLFSFQTKLKILSNSFRGVLTTFRVNDTTWWRGSYHDGRPRQKAEWNDAANDWKVILLAEMLTRAIWGEWGKRQSIPRGRGRGRGRGEGPSAKTVTKARLNELVTFCVLNRVPLCGNTRSPLPEWHVVKQIDIEIQITLHQILLQWR